MDTRSVTATAEKIGRTQSAVSHSLSRLREQLGDPPPGGTAVMVVGQAPGVTESEVGRPFNGPSGRRLFRWLAQAGWEEGAFRATQYMSAVTKCYTGKGKGGKALVSSLCLLRFTGVRPRRNKRRMGELLRGQAKHERVGSR